MKIAFIVKPFVIEPLGIAYLSSVLKLDGHDVRLFKVEDIYPMIRSWSPDILAYSVTTGQHEYFLKLNREIKREGMFSIFGGPHPTYFPGMANEKGVDFIIRGEGEASFRSLVHYLQITGDRLKMHPKVVGPVDLIQDLDSIPYPDREIIYTYEENRNNPIKNVMTSRGCPFSCPYCFNSLYRKMYQGQRWTRYRKPDNVIAECVSLKKYPLKLIFFQDDEFIMNPELNRLLKQYGIYVRVPFHCQLRIENLTRDIAAKLKGAGCISVTFAIESGDQHFRIRTLKRSILDGQIKEGAKILKEYGLMYRTENMVGLPGEELEQMLKTYDLNRSISPTLGWCSIFQPYPNLPLSVQAKENGQWNGELNMEESFFEKTILDFKRKENQVENLQRLFGIGIHLNIPVWIMRWLIKLPMNFIFDQWSREFKKNRYKLLYGMEDSND